MLYRKMGRCGLKLSVLSLGSWATYHERVDRNLAVEMMAAAFDAGVNFFDNAEGYAEGRSEEIMGQALRALAWPRVSYVVSSKYFFGLADGGNGINRNKTLNRKYLMQAIDGSLQRFGLEYIDLIYCHRSDPSTPIDETVRAMNDIIEQGKALYWGTSEWSAAEIRAAWEIADRHGWHRPVVEQPQYNLFHRRRVEEEYLRLYDDIGLGLTTWSPLAYGLLTGKYAQGIPPDSRGTMASMAFLRNRLTDAAKNAAVKSLEPIAAELGASVSQLAIAWAAANPNVSSVITGASRIEQLHSNLQALPLIEKMTPQILGRIDVATRGLAD